MPDQNSGNAVPGEPWPKRGISLGKERDEALGKGERPSPPLANFVDEEGNTDVPS